MYCDRNHYTIIIIMTVQSDCYVPSSNLLFCGYEVIIIIVHTHQQS
jgi:hypothetical protein